MSSRTTVPTPEAAGKKRRRPPSFPMPAEMQAEIDEAKERLFRVWIKAAILYGHGVATIKWKKKYGKSPVELARRRK